MYLRALDEFGILLNIRSNARVIDSQQNLIQRYLLELWYIRTTRDTMNRENGSLPEIYNTLTT